MSKVYLDLLNTFVENGLVKCTKTNLLLGQQVIETLEYSLEDRKKEDKTYTNQALRYTLPRGLCVIKIDDIVIHIVTGIVKFGYDGDYEKDSSSDIVTKQFAEKENGQCCHVSSFMHCSQQYIVFGSKMVHLIARTSHLREDIDSYIDKKRYTVAIKIANLSVEKYSHAIDNVVEFCNVNKVTLCGEAIFPDDQHIVDYCGNKSLRFFAITCPIEKDDSLTWCNPIDARHHFQEMGLDVIEKIVSVTSFDWENCAKDFRNATNSEGAVVYCLDRDGNVIFIYKDKNYFYSFWRAVREQLRNRANLENFLKRLRNPQFENLPDIETLIVRAIQFRAFFFKLSQEDQMRFFTKWNDYYTLFDKLSFEDKEDKEALVAVEQTAYTEFPSDGLVVTMLIGSPGSGKSSLAAMLPGTHIEQDMFCGNSDPKKEYHRAIERHASDPNCKYLVLAKSNITHVMRQEARDILNRTGRPYQIYYVEFELKKDVFYLERINNRGDAHRTLRPSNKIRGIISRFIKDASANPLSVEEESTSLRINPENSMEDNFRQVVGFFTSRGLMDIELNDEIIESALKNVAAYEESNLKFAATIPEKSEKIVAKSKPMFDAIVFQTSEHQTSDIQQLVESTLLDKVLKTELHTTITFYQKGKPIRTDLNFGEEVRVNVIGYASDEKATVLLLDKDEHVMNLQVQAEYPHITFALANGVLPFYSNELVKRCITENTIHLFDKPITLVGIVTRF